MFTSHLFKSIVASGGITRTLPHLHPDGAPIYVRTSLIVEDVELLVEMTGEAVRKTSDALRSGKLETPQIILCRPGTSIFATALALNLGTIPGAGHLRQIWARPNEAGTSMSIRTESLPHFDGEAPVLLVADAATSGRSIEMLKEAAEYAGGKVVGAVVLFNCGGVEAESCGLDCLISVFGSEFVEYAVLSDIPPTPAPIVRRRYDEPVTMGKGRPSWQS